MENVQLQFNFMIIPRGASILSSDGRRNEASLKTRNSAGLIEANFRTTRTIALVTFVLWRNPRARAKSPRSIAGCPFAAAPRVLRRKCQTGRAHSASERLPLASAARQCRLYNAPTNRPIVIGGYTRKTRILREAARRNAARLAYLHQLHGSCGGNICGTKRARNCITKDCGYTRCS